MKTIIAVFTILMAASFSANAQYSQRCTAQLLEDGRIIRTFRDYYGGGYGNNSCREVLRECNREAVRLRNRGYGYRNYRCRTIRGGNGGGGYGNQSASCTFERTDRYGYFIANHTVRANGYNYYEAEQRACQEARRSCEQRRSYNQNCRRRY